MLLCNFKQVQMQNFFGIRLRSMYFTVIQNTALYSRLWFHRSFSQRNFTLTSQCYMQPAIWAMYVVMKLDARGAVLLNELTAVLLSGYILMETISAAVPWGGSLNNACESSGSQWPEAYPPLLLPLMAYPVRVTGQHVACWTVLHSAQTTAARFWFQKQSRATKVITGFKRALGENVTGASGQWLYIFHWFCSLFSPNLILLSITWRM